MDSSLPVVQLKESHALAVDPNLTPSGGWFTLALAAYPRMSVGDQVKLTWEGFFSDGSPDTPEVFNKTLVGTDVGKVLTWALDPGYVGFIDGGTAQMSYQLVYADAQDGTADSEIQTLDIVPPSVTRLPLVTIENHSGSTIDPAEFPQGVPLKILAYPDIQPEDYVLLYAMGRPGSVSVVRSLRVDQGIIDAGEISFSLEQSWLRDQIDETVTFEYQYARPGSAKSSEVLELDVRAAWRPAAPTVLGALPEPVDPLPNQGFIGADDLRAGAQVSIPVEVELGLSDTVEVHWQGHGSSGSHVAASAEPGDPRTFVIPPAAVPANMGKRVQVFYTVKRPGESLATSIAFDLRIVPLPKDRFSTIQSQCVNVGKLLLSCVPASGLELTLNRWMFMAPGQLLTIKVESSANTGVLENFPIEEQHVTANKVVATLSRDYLQRLAEGARVTFKVAVSFDDGICQTDFPDLPLILAA